MEDAARPAAKALTTQTPGIGSVQTLATCSTAEARSFLPLREAAAHKTLPLHVIRDGSSVTLRCAVTTDSDDLRSKLRFLCGVEVTLTILPPSLLEEGIVLAYLGSVERLAAGLAEISGRHTSHVAAIETVPFPEPTGDAAKFLTAILEFSAARNASDLHLCPGGKGAVVKIRIDGELMSQESQPYASALHAQVVLRLKALASLNVASRRLPQDGAFSFVVAGRQRAARLSIVPTCHGESAVIRFLHTRELPSVDELELEAEVLRALRGAMLRTQGMVLVTGPTGSGKSTTLSAVAKEIKQSGRNVVTVEDPVEIDLPGVVQVPVNEEQGLSYPRAIRSILRHDPDVIMIGEIRDAESARIALESAATGHLTVSSLHVGSALFARDRLQARGVPRQISVPTVSLVISQRLIRALCEGCKRRDAVASRVFGADVFTPGGCSACQDSGYVGRAVVAELLDLRSEEAKDAALSCPTATNLGRALPDRAYRSWEWSLRALACSGKISARQVSEFIEREQ